MKNNGIYRLYPKAVQDLESIYEYSLETFGQEKADDYVKEIENSFQAIVDNQKITRTCDSIRRGLKIFHVGSHVIFFEVAIYGITVIRVLHKSMDFMRHF